MNYEMDITPAFIQAVHEAVADIPRGKVMTYGQVAEAAGQPGAAREVGRIMSRVQSELHLPCHRVVNKTGILSPEYAFGGPDRQRSLLESEGVTFLSDGRIHMQRHQWSDEEQLFLF